MIIKTDKFTIEYMGAIVWNEDDFYETDEFEVTLEETGDICSVGYDYTKNIICSKMVLNQKCLNPDVREKADKLYKTNQEEAIKLYMDVITVSEDSNRKIQDINADIDNMDFELRHLFRFMHDYAYFHQY